MAHRAPLTDVPMTPSRPRPIDGQPVALTDGTASLSFVLSISSRTTATVRSTRGVPSGKASSPKYPVAPLWPTGPCGSSVIVPRLNAWFQNEAREIGQRPAKR